MHRTLFRIVALMAVGLIAAVALQAGGKKKPKKPNQPPSFAYYMLVLSYAPDFCAQPAGVKDPRECGNGRHVGFVVHGLWPQGETTRGPENCGSASPVAQSTVQAMLQYIPTESLIQHEWKAHGTCSGLSADDYFAAVKKARDSVTIPDELTPSSRQSMTTADIEAKVASANPGFPTTAFRTSCYSDKELQELRICLNKDLSPRACGSSAGRCSATTVTLLPVH
jgi:ribonuclease T2